MPRAARLSSTNAHPSSKGTDPSAGSKKVFKSLKPLSLYIATLSISLTLSPAAAGPGPACYAPSDLAARPGEEHPVKGDHHFDAPAPAQLLAPFSPVPSALRGAIRRVELPKGKKLIALTFDLCEQPGEVAGYDGAIFDYLRANGIKATLFTGGKWMRSHPTRIRQLMTDPLFEIANHSEAHRNLRLLSGAALESEVAGPQRTYELIRANASNDQCLAPTVGHTPPRLALFRFPYGACNDVAMAAVNDAGLLAIQWDVATGDPSPGVGATEIANAMIHGARPGSIIISHANGRGWHTAAGLPLAIPRLKAAGYEFVTVGELLAAGKPVIAATCYDSRPGDTDRYDHPLGLFAKARTGRSTTSTGASGDTLPWATTVAPSASATPQPRKPQRTPPPQPSGWWPW